MLARMSRFTAQPLVLVGCAIACTARADVTVQHADELVGYNIAAAHAPTSAAPGAMELGFNALGKDFAVALEPNARLGPMVANLGGAAGATAYRGSLRGRPGSWARIVLTPQGPSGLIADGGELYGIESERSAANPRGNPTIFRLADVYIEPGTLSCGASRAPADAATTLAAMVAELETLEAQGASLNLDLGVVADFEFSAAFGGAAEAALLTRVNNVDGIFSEQVGVQVTVAEVDIFTDPNDPFTVSDASDLLNELAVYRGATPAQDAQGLTHLFTGRDMDGTTAGVAFLGALCARRSRFDALQRSFGAGLSEARRGPTLDSLLAAHEIGHNFGAPHDAEADSACASTPEGFLMAPSPNPLSPTRNRFSQCSLDEMGREIATAACLTPIGPADLVAVAQPNASVSAGTAFDFRASVTNRGVDAAGASTLTVTAENGLQVLGASAGCTALGQIATCDFGSIAGGSARDATVSLRGNSIGEFDVALAASSPDDAVLGNNSATATVTVLPVVDLVVAATAGAVEINRQTTIAASVDNTGDFNANGVVLAATLSEGLRADQATLGGAACTLSGQTVNCAPQALAARGRVALSLTLTGLTVGAQQVSFSATATERERNASDNSLPISINVTAPPAPSGGGGGTVSWLAVLALASAVAARGSRTTARDR